MRTDFWHGVPGNSLTPSHDDPRDFGSLGKGFAYVAAGVVAVSLGKIVGSGTAIVFKLAAIVGVMLLLFLLVLSARFRSRELLLWLVLVSASMNFAGGLFSPESISSEDATAKAFKDVLLI